MTGCSLGIPKRAMPPATRRCGGRWSGTTQSWCTAPSKGGHSPAWWVGGAMSSWKWWVEAMSRHYGNGGWEGYIIMEMVDGRGHIVTEMKWEMIVCG